MKTKRSFIVGVIAMGLVGLVIVLWGAHVDAYKKGSGAGTSNQSVQSGGQQLQSFPSDSGVAIKDKVKIWNGPPPVSTTPPPTGVKPQDKVKNW